MKARDRLRIAVQKSGRLSDPAFDLLERCGLSFERGSDRLFCFSESEPVDLLLVRDDDIPALLAQGACDLGIVGRNKLNEFSSGMIEPPRELRALGFGACRLAIAVPRELDCDDVQALQDLRIATSHPKLLARWLEEREVSATVVTLSGSVEIAPRLGTADAVCDLVQSGATLAANRLREVETVLQSTAVLAAPATVPEGARGELLALLLARLDSAMHPRAARLLMLRSARDCLNSILRLLPPASRTSVLDVVGQPGQVMLQAWCAGDLGWRKLEEIKRAGARELFVLPVEKALA